MRRRGEAGEGGAGLAHDLGPGVGELRGAGAEVRGRGLSGEAWWRMIMKLVRVWWRREGGGEGEGGCGR